MSKSFDDGCYGAEVTPSELIQFLEYCFEADNEEEKNNSTERFATCIWGTAGIGKTQLVRSFENRPVIFDGKRHDGYKVVSVPLGQAEEMGDILGMPARHLMVARGSQSIWVPEQVVSSYVADGWKIDHAAGVTTRYAPPGWVPVSDGPCILLLDDWNRANQRVVKGCMQLMQEYGTIGWSLPRGCHIVTTGNPANKDYLVSQLDSAMLTRMRSVTLKADAKLWAQWADGCGLDSRGISFILRYPENLVSGERTNPRTLAGLFRHTKCIGDLSVKENARKMEVIANSMVDSTVAASMVVFMSKDVSMVTDPEEIVSGSVDVEALVKKLVSLKDSRLDILSLIVERLLIHIFNRAERFNKEEIKNIYKFVLANGFPEDTKFAFCHRLNSYDKKDTRYILVAGGKEVTDMIFNAMTTK